MRRRLVLLLPFGGWVLAACRDRSATPPTPREPSLPMPRVTVPTPTSPAAETRPKASTAASSSASPAAPADPASSASAELPMLDATDPAAQALGYVSVSARADDQKYPTHSDDQRCGNCALFAGKPGDATGPCPLFQGHRVARSGWCSAYVRQA